MQTTSPTLFADDNGYLKKERTYLKIYTQPTIKHNMNYENFLLWVTTVMIDTSIVSRILGSETVSSYTLHWL